MILPWVSVSSWSFWIRASQVPVHAVLRWAVLLQSVHMPHPPVCFPVLFLFWKSSRRPSSEPGKFTSNSGKVETSKETVVKTECYLVMSSLRPSGVTFTPVYCGLTALRTDLSHPRAPRGSEATAAHSFGAAAVWGRGGAALRLLRQPNRAQKLGSTALYEVFPGVSGTCKAKGGDARWRDTATLLWEEPHTTTPSSPRAHRRRSAPRRRAAPGRLCGAARLPQPAPPTDRLHFPAGGAGPSISGSGAASLGWQRRRLPGAGPARRRGGCPERGVRSLLGSAAEGGETAEVSGRSAPCLICGKCGSWWTRREYGGGRACWAGGRGGSVSSPQPGPLSPPASPRNMAAAPPPAEAVASHPFLARPTPALAALPPGSRCGPGAVCPPPGEAWLLCWAEAASSQPLAFPLWQAAFRALPGSSGPSRSWRAAFPL